MNISKKLLIMGLLGLGILPAYGDYLSQVNLNQQFVTAVNTGDVSKLTSLLAAGADVDTPINRLGETALMRAIATDPNDDSTDLGKDSTIELLLAAGANVNATTTEGGTPLIYAFELGRPNVSSLLLANGAF